MFMPDKETKASQQGIEVARELMAAEHESETVSVRHDHDEVIARLRSKITTVQKSK